MASFSVSLALALRGDRTSELNIVCFPDRQPGQTVLSIIAIAGQKRPIIQNVLFCQGVDILLNIVLH